MDRVVRIQRFHGADQGIEIVEVPAVGVLVSESPDFDDLPGPGYSGNCSTKQSIHGSPPSPWHPSVLRKKYRLTMPVAFCPGRVLLV